MPNVDNLKADQDNGRDPINGIYRARVESNLDPLHLGRVKCRVPQLHGIPGGDSALDNDGLPWAYPITLTGTGYNHGSCVVPETGDYVFVMFENGDRNSPVYMGGCYGIPTQGKEYGNVGDDASSKSMHGGKGWISAPDTNETPQEVYPVGDAPNGKVIYKSPKGFIIMTHETDNEESLIIADNDNQQIMISNPADNSVSEISIDGKDGQGIHVRSTPGGIAEVTILSPAQTTMIQVTDEKVLVKSKAIEIEAEESISIKAKNLNVEVEEGHNTKTDTYNIEASSSTFKGDLTVTDGNVNLN